jgi:hypothetical protein
MSVVFPAPRYPESLLEGCHNKPGFCLPVTIVIGTLIGLGSSSPLPPTSTSRGGASSSSKTILRSLERKGRNFIFSGLENL